MKKFDVKQHVTDRIIERLENVGEFEMPFDSFRSVNFKTKKAYRGINILLLGFAGRSTPYWGTKKQWASVDASKKSGETGTQIVFWNMIEIEEDDGEIKKIPFAKYFRVYNADQVDGWEAPESNKIDETEVVASADDFFSVLNIETEVGCKACYIPSRDLVQMPARKDFHATKTSSATECYYSTLAHEYTHATSHKSRCDRDMKSYAAEELVAEIGAAVLCGQLGISNEMRDDHVAYIKGWLKALRNDKNFIFSASSKAQKAVDWMEKQQLAVAA